MKNEQSGAEVHGDETQPQPTVQPAVGAIAPTPMTTPIPSPDVTPGSTPRVDGDDVKEEETQTELDKQMTPEKREEQAKIPREGTSIHRSINQIVLAPPPLSVSRQNAILQPGMQNNNAAHALKIGSTTPPGTYPRK